MPYHAVRGVSTTISTLFVAAFADTEGVDSLLPVVATVTVFSLLMFSMILERSPWEIQHSGFRQSSLFREIPVPQNLSLAHSTVFRLFVFLISASISGWFCSNLALILGVHFSSATVSDFVLSSRGSGAHDLVKGQIIFEVFCLLCLYIYCSEELYFTLPTSHSAGLEWIQRTKESNYIGIIFAGTFEGI